jgi:hypothetical protein
MVGAMVGLMIKLVVGPMAQDVVDSREVVVVAAPPLPSKMSPVRYARSMGILLVSVGGVMQIEMMMMIPTLMRKVHMALTQTGIWIAVPLITSLVN